MYSPADRAAEPGRPPPEAVMRTLARLVLVSVVFLVAAAFVSSSWAQAQDGPPASPDASAGTPAAGAAKTADDYVAEIRAAYTPENHAYVAERRRLAFVDPLVSILVALLLLATGLSARFRDLAERVSRRRYLQVLVYLALFSVVTWVLGLPLEWYRDYALEHRFGLSTQSFGAWFGDSAKGVALGVLMFGVLPVMWLVYKALKSSPRRWWLRLALGTVPFMMLLMLLQPLVIEPVFNKFKPLANVELRNRIVALAERAEIPGRKVLEADKSKQTTKYNAYVSGFGASQRIVLWDTTLKGLQEDEILCVMAHEMGHYKLGHIWMLIVFTGVLGFGVFWVAARLVNGLTARYGPRWGFREVGDLASLPLLLAVLSLVMFAIQPATNSFSRWMERDSDTFGLEVTQANDAAARAFIKLGSQNKSDPEPSALIEAWLYTHPPLAERVRYAIEYRPWESGQPNRKFKPKR
jgi:Zn-dependent protease with chaperone function